jgi:hypothetical protein
MVQVPLNVVSMALAWRCFLDFLEGELRILKVRLAHRQCYAQAGEQVS